VCYEPEHGKAKADIFEQPHVDGLVTGPQQLPACAASDALALLSAKDCDEPKSYRDDLAIEQAQDWQAAMKHDNTSLTANGTWELDDLLPNRVVVNNMWTYKIKSDT
jgi:hypothetical protein